MQGSAQLKVRGGKLVRVCLDHDGAFITASEVSGDFFVHPEEALEFLEGALVGLPVGSTESEVALAIGRVLSERNATVVGFTPADLASVVARALL